MKRISVLSAALIFTFQIAATCADAKPKHSPKSEYMSYEGLVMAGYQGWFNAPGDGADRWWNHYRKGKKFEPGACTIDAWPDMAEYEKKYETGFVHSDGSPAFLFSSYDKSTTDLHFRWMKEYGIDGVFMQRFVVTLKSDAGRNHYNTIIRNALEAASVYDRAICIMYDLSGMNPEDVDVVIEDWKCLVDDNGLTSGKKNTYLYHNGKPLVAVWGVGFGGGRKYGYKEAWKLIDFFKNDPKYGGCSILLGVPARWRGLGSDTDGNPELHNVIKSVDIVHPWYVNRYNEKTIGNFYDLFAGDIEWCKENGLDYVPVIFPGFSWYNMKPDSQFEQNPRNGGRFFWKQIAKFVELGAGMFYYAMFDEIDEGTAIFKISDNPPVGPSRFIDNDGLPSDWYLRLAGLGGKMMRGETGFTEELPISAKKLPPVETYRNRYGHIVERYENGRLELKREKALEKVLGNELFAIPDLYVKYRYSPDRIGAGEYASKSFTVNYKESGESGDSLRIEVELPVSSEGPVPFLVWIHGGGWHGGTPEAMKNESIYFADKGYASFRVQYRLRPAAGTNEDQLRDIADAVAFIKRNAEKFGIDPDSYVYLGGSAGGQLAVISGINDKACSGIVPLYAVYDIRGFYDFLMEIGQKKELEKELSDFFSMDEPDKYSRYNPCDAIVEDMPPVLVIHGTGDSTAPYSHCEKFISRMEDSGNRCDVHTFRFYEHNFTGKNNSDAYEEVQLSILSFLDSIFGRNLGHVLD